MLKNITILLTICLVVSCAGSKQICREVKKAEIKPQILCDLSLEDMTCTCSCYDLNKVISVEDAQCGSLFKSGKYEPARCDGIAGFYTEKWAADIIPKLERQKNVKKQYCGE